MSATSGKMEKAGEASAAGVPRRDTGALPSGYGKTEIVLLPRDPFNAFAYWELPDGEISALKQKVGGDIYGKSRYLLRVYDITGINFTGTNAHKYFDIYINDRLGNWYISMPEPNKDWCVDLGLLLPDNTFLMVKRSNMVHMPRTGVSSVTDEQWAMLEGRYERLMELSGINKLGKGSFDIAKALNERYKEFMSVSSLRSSPMGISSFKKAPVEEKSFWFKANTELIVYGSTESDAQVFVGGERIPLRPDGSFSLRFSLDDGKKEIPIVAKSADNKFKKGINFIVTRLAKPANLID